MSQEKEARVRELLVKAAARDPLLPPGRWKNRIIVVLAIVVVIQAGAIVALFQFMKRPVNLSFDAYGRVIEPPKPPVLLPEGGNLKLPRENSSTSPPDASGRRVHPQVRIPF